MQPNAKLINLVGRILFFGMIVWIVVSNFLDMPSAIGYAQSKGVPLANLLVPLAQFMLGVAGVLIITGFLPKVGLLIFMGFLAVVTLMMHQWWNLAGFDLIIEVHSFQSNLLLLGLAGMLWLTADSWPYTLKDWVARRGKG